MAKKSLCLLLAVLLAFPVCCACAESWENVSVTRDLTPGELPRLYTARMRIASRVYDSVYMTQGYDTIDYIPAKVRVIVHALTPTFALITYEKNGVTGFLKRLCLEEPETLDPVHTPPYGVEVNAYTARIAAQDAPVMAEPGGGETLITLHEGTWLSIIGFENGRAKVVYHRQYGYVDSGLLTELTPAYVCPAEEAGTEYPLASFTSFYKITTDESNLGRMNNITVGCEKLRAITLYPGNDFDFNRDLGPYNASAGYKPATVLVDGKAQQGYGGGTCQVSSTLYNVLLQLPGITILQRRAHGDNGASYLPIGVDAAVGNSTLNLRFRNDYPFAVRIEAWAKDGALTIAMYKAE